MTVREDIQKLDPGTLVELFELDATALGGDVAFFHGHAHMQPIWWNGNQYSGWPIKAEGFARTGEQQPVPKLAVGNVNGSISALCIYFDDLVGAKLTMRQTFAKYLDAVNFPDGNPTADPTQEFPPEVWFIDRKSGESSDVVEFELASALDFNGVQLPRRQIIAGRCLWLSIGGYRGPYCNYTGGPVAKADGTPTSNMAEDRCGGLVRDCKLRFGINDVLNFGGFPAAGLVRT